MLIERQDPESGEILQLTPEQFVIRRDDILTKWRDSKTALEKAKDAERKLRDEAVWLLGDPAKAKGTENIELGGGWIAKLVKKINYGWVKDKSEEKVDTHAVEQALRKIEEFGEAGILIAERLVKWTPELSLTEYNQLPPDMRKIIDPVIRTSPGAPTLEIVPPKAAKR